MKLKQLLSYYFLLSILLIPLAKADIIVGQSNAWDIPEFKLKGIDGKIHSLDEWKGKVILLNFWATWCPPCILEIKDFIKFQKHFIKNNLQIVSIGVDEPEKLKHISQSMNINYPILLVDIEQQSGKDMLTQWGNPDAHVPYSVVIDTDGKIHYIYKGKLDTGRFDYYVVPLLKH
jgi:peroxiredoxin